MGIMDRAGHASVACSILQTILQKGVPLTNVVFGERKSLASAFGCVRSPCLQGILQGINGPFPSTTGDCRMFDV